MSREKVVSRKIVIIPGIVIIILLIGLIGAISTIETLKAPQLHVVNLRWERHEPRLGAHYLRVTGLIFNSGTYTAKNVRMHYWLYDSYGRLIVEGIRLLGDIPGKTYLDFAFDIYYEGHCEHYKYEIIYD
ncbi:MAG: hypothetical protein QXW55_04340 [Candidatus Bathyarchaeia archaeon]